MKSFTDAFPSSLHNTQRNDELTKRQERHILVRLAARAELYLGRRVFVEDGAGPQQLIHLHLYLPVSAHCVCP